MSPDQIISLFRELDINCPPNAQPRIADFCAQHYQIDLCANKLKYIIMRLAIVHTWEESAHPQIRANATRMLRFIYTQASFSVDEMHILAETLISVNNHRTVTRNINAILLNNSVHKPLVQTILSFIQYAAMESNINSYMHANPIITGDINSKFNAGDHTQYDFGYYEILGERDQQEDTIAWSPIAEEVLKNLSSEEIGQRLWTTYQNLNSKFRLQYSGTTASTTVCTRDNLITATLSDTIAFAIVYGKDDDFTVIRLNKRIRHADDPDETARIQQAGGFVKDNRIQGDLSPTRVIGDRNYKGVCCDADIDILDLNSFPHATKIQLLTACDGFTEPLVYEEEREDSKENCEEFLERYLKLISRKFKQKIADMSEFQISKYLVAEALRNGSEDNISIAVQTVSKGPFHFSGMLGVYDGHGGHMASHFVANSIIEELTTQLNKNHFDYAEQANSVQNKHLEYARDNINPCTENTLNTMSI